MFYSGFQGMDGAAPSCIQWRGWCDHPAADAKCCLCLCRADSRTLVLKNDTLLPMDWQLSGLDDLAEDFSLSQYIGTIDPRTEFEVTLDFKARRIGNIEKILRLEVRGTVLCLAEQGTASSCVLLRTLSGRAAPHRHKGAVTPTSASAQHLPERAVHPHPPR